MPPNNMDQHTVELNYRHSYGHDEKTAQAVDRLEYNSKLPTVQAHRAGSDQTLDVRIPRYITESLRSTEGVLLTRVLL